MLGGDNNVVEYAEAAPGTLRRVVPGGAHEGVRICAGSRHNLVYLRHHEKRGGILQRQGKPSWRYRRRILREHGFFAGRGEKGAGSVIAAFGERGEWGAEPGAALCGC